MAHYLRDERITNILINANNISQISAVFSDRLRLLNVNVPEDDDSGKKGFLTYIIRFDNKGYRVFTLEELLRFFNIANNIERIIFTVETGQSLSTDRKIGSILELRLDQNDSNNCYLSVSADDQDWVDASFSAVRDVLVKCKNKNGWARSAWTKFGVQIFGVTLGFIISLWSAAKIAPRLEIENSLIISFLFVFIIFSNIWTYLNQKILWILNIAFPNMKFYRQDKERLQWLLQAVVGGIVVAIVIFVLSQAFIFLFRILGSLFRL